MGSVIIMSECGMFLQENNRSELERIDKERHSDFLSMLRGFVVNQVPYIYLLCSANFHIYMAIYSSEQ